MPTTQTKKMTTMTTTTARHCASSMYLSHSVRVEQPRLVLGRR